MGKKSVKENKNIYQEAREGQELTRAEAAEKLEWISESRIEKIEYEKSIPHPDEVLLMSKVYKKPDLCNYYCSHECQIGQEYVPAIDLDGKNLPQITLEMLATLNSMVEHKDNLIRIAADGQVTSDEKEDFRAIQDTLDQMSLAIESLKLWVKNTME